MMISPSFGALAHVSKDRASRPSLNEGDILVQAGFDKDKVKYQFLRFKAEDANFAAIDRQRVAQGARCGEEGAGPRRVAAVVVRGAHANFN